jgi:hypothetical protein
VWLYLAQKRKGRKEIQFEWCDDSANSDIKGAFYLATANAKLDAMFVRSKYKGWRWENSCER